ncbi:MAG TPA: regulatory protein RecX [Marmoricola sp.]|nr:regulatory protein RecX [Marmoricola sp.]HNJ78626.1 regulatory protein RecX [Marmoricola sp.]
MKAREEPTDPQQDLGPEADPESVARKILLDQLTTRQRTRAELATKLAQRNVPAELAARLLDRFEEVGLIDDRAFARDWIEQRQRGRGLAKRALAVELRNKGVPDDIAQEALLEIAAEDEEEVARALVAAKLRSVRNLEKGRATRRLVGMLARKGHSPGLAYRVVAEMLEV